MALYADATTLTSILYSYALSEGRIFLGAAGLTRDERSGISHRGRHQ